MDDTLAPSKTPAPPEVATALVGLACAVLVRATLPASRGFEPVPADPRRLLAMTRTALSDPALLALYAIGGTMTGALVAVYNAVGFRLTAAPFSLGLGAASLVFLVYPLGSLSSAWFGRLADARGRRSVIPIGVVIAVIGVLLTLADSLPLIGLGLAVLIVGFFAVHGIASGWVPVRAHAVGTSASQAASLYLVSYYLAFSVFGTLAGLAWTHAHWPGVVVLALALLAVTGVLTRVLWRTPALVPGQG